MSWMFGYIGHSISPDLRSRFAGIHGEPLYRTESTRLYLAAGGIPDTCLVGVPSDKGDEKTQGWIVVGCGIVPHEGYCEVLSAEQWASILSSPTPDFKHLNGHYIAIQWQQECIVCYSDLFGLRSFYFAHIEGGVAFSTRIDWLSRLMKRVEIDLEEFGAHWHAFNQLSYKSLVKGIERLPPNAVASCRPDSISINAKPWTPEFSSPDPDDHRALVAALRSLIHPRTSKTYRLSLGLSGGLDSRLLFALLRSDQRPFLLHLFGHPGEPDVQVAQTIATDQDVEQDFYCDPIPGQDESIRILREYIPQSSLVATASSMLKLRYYPKMYAENKMLIDGGMGEIGRRQFMNRLLLRGKRALRTKNARAIGRHMSVHRASIFSDEVNVIMKGGIEKQIQSIWDTMPEVNQIGEENFLDLLIVRYRFPNYGGMEQARMDGEILNYMPFAQPLFVRAAFETPLHMRRKSRLYRQLIDTHCPALKKYPLVKGVTTYPYALSAVSALIWTKLKSKCRHQFVDPTPVDFLTTILEFIRDTVHSVSVSSFPLYNHRALVSMVEEFYTGKKGLARDVDWWLAFEVWRQSLRA